MVWDGGIVSYLAQQAQDLEAAAVDLERRRAGEAVQAAPEGREEVEENLGHGGRLVGGSVNWVVVAVPIPIDGGRAVADSSLAECPVVVVVVVSRIKFRCDRCSSDRANCWIRQPDTETAREHRCQINPTRNSATFDKQSSQKVLSSAMHASAAAKMTLPRNGRQHRGGSVFPQRTQPLVPTVSGAGAQWVPSLNPGNMEAFPLATKRSASLHRLGMARGMDWIHSEIHPPVQATTIIRSDGEQ